MNAKRFILMMLVMLMSMTTTWAQNSVIHYTATQQLVLSSTLQGVESHTYDPETQEGTITFDRTLTEIPTGAFARRTSLTTITFPESLTSIRDMAFQDCTSLTSITFPESLTSIRDMAFENCTSLSSITFPESLTSIEGNAFKNCTSLTSISIPASVNSFGYGSFNGCSSIKSVTINGQVALNAMNSFESRFGNYPEECILTGEISEIRPYTFNSCSNLHTVTLPSSLNKIQFGAFYGCVNLQTINLWATTPPDATDTNVFRDVPTSISIFVPKGSGNAYKDADGWKDFPNIKEYTLSYSLEDQAVYNEQNSFKALTFSYTRNFADIYWTTWYVPFDLELTNELCQKYAFSRINNVHQYDNDNDGIADETVIESFRQQSGTTIKANYPYLVKALGADDLEMRVELTDKMLEGNNEESIDCQSVDYKYTFTGTYAGMGDSGISPTSPYSLNDTYWDEKWYHFESLPAQRHYLTITPRNAVSPAQAPARISMRVIGEEDATGVVSLYTKPVESNVIYDLMGRRIHNSNQRGLRIENGRVILK